MTYDRLAEIAGEYLRTGRLIYIEGRLKYGKYIDQGGVEKPTVDIIASELQLLGARDERSATSSQGPTHTSGRPQLSSRAADSTAAVPTSPPSAPDLDFDIPF